MAFLGQALLAFWHDIAPGGEAQFDQWHLREHIPERLAERGRLRRAPERSSPLCPRGFGNPSRSAAGRS